MKLPSFYPILDTEAAARRNVNLADAAAQVIEGGARILQFRHKGFWSRGVFETLERVAELCRSTGVQFVVNDRADLAKLVNAALHLGPGRSAAVGGAAHRWGRDDHWVLDPQRSATPSRRGGTGRLPGSGANLRNSVEGESRSDGRIGRIAEAASTHHEATSRDRRHHARKCSRSARRWRGFGRGHRGLVSRGRRHRAGE